MTGNHAFNKRCPHCINKTFRSLTLWGCPSFLLTVFFFGLLYTEYSRSGKFIYFPVFYIADLVCNYVLQSLQKFEYSSDTHFSCFRWVVRRLHRVRYLQNGGSGLGACIHLSKLEGFLLSLTFHPKLWTLTPLGLLSSTNRRGRDLSSSELVNPTLGLLSSTNIRRPQVATSWRPWFD